MCFLTSTASCRHEYQEIRSVHRTKVWKLKEEETKLIFMAELQSCNSDPESTIEEKWDSLEKVPLQAVDKLCGCTKKPCRHKVI